MENTNPEVVYTYDTNTLEYAGPYTPRQRYMGNVEASTYVPANSLKTKPPEAVKGKAIVADVEAGVWNLVDDFRGVMFTRKTDGLTMMVEKPGQTPEELGYLPYASRPSDIYDWVDGAWTVNQAKANTILATDARKKRDALLVEADVLIKIAEDDGDGTAALRDYRKLLRAVPEQADFPVTIDWPVLP